MQRIIGIGTDITECLRIAQMIERHAELFINRVFTPQETKFCQSRKHATQHFAGRWAAKEAALKALGTGWRRGIRWRDVEVISEGRGAPTIELHGEVRNVAKQLGIDRVMLSIAHCRSHATAYAIAVAEN